MKRSLPPLLILMLVVVAASTVLGGCGGTSSADKALFDRMTAVWTKQDAAGANEVFASDANVYWNWSDTPETFTGIDKIAALVANGTMGHPTSLGNEIFTYVPSVDDIKNLTSAYDGARYIAGPVYVARGLYLVTLEVRNGKIANQYVEALFSQ